MLQRENRLKTPFYKAKWIPFDENKETLRQYAERFDFIDEKWSVERQMFRIMTNPTTWGFGENHYKLSKKMKKFWNALREFFDDIGKEEYSDYSDDYEQIIPEVRAFFAEYHPKITVFEGILYEETISFAEVVFEYLDYLEDEEDEEDEDEDFDFDDDEGDDYE